MQSLSCIRRKKPTINIEVNQFIFSFGLIEKQPGIKRGRRPHGSVSNSLEPFRKLRVL